MTDKHRPGFGELVRKYETEHGDRYEFRFPSASKVGAFHAFHVNADGSRPVCDCFPFRVRKACYLTDHARDVIEEYHRSRFREFEFSDLEAIERSYLDRIGSLGESGRIEFSALGDVMGEVLGSWFGEGAGA